MESVYVRVMRDVILNYFLKKRFYLFIFREGEGRENERGRNNGTTDVDWLPLASLQLGTWPTAQDMCPDWEPNGQPFDSQAGTQSTEPHQPECELPFCTDY